MNDATQKLIDAAFEMSAATKKDYPTEGTPEFFALTDVAHRLECACIAYKQALAQPATPPLPSGEDKDTGDLKRLHRIGQYVRSKNIIVHEYPIETVPLDEREKRQVGELNALFSELLTLAPPLPSIGDGKDGERP